MDELFEALTLAQTKRIKSFPIILYGSEYWKGLFDWMKTTTCGERDHWKGGLCTLFHRGQAGGVRFLINEHFRVFAELRPKKRAKKRSKSDARRRHWQTARYS